MANLEIDHLIGGRPLANRPLVDGFALQIHITSLCDQNCIHCYFSKEIHKEKKNELNCDQWKELIDEYFVFIDKYKQGNNLIAITGGDPLLDPKFFEILSYIHEYYGKKTSIEVMGNPFHITKENVLKMKELGVENYQISLDGLEDTHDSYRKKGSFKRSIEAIRTIKEAGLSTIVACTISKKNVEDLIPLMEYLDSLNIVDLFGFERMIPIGNGEIMKSELFSPFEYRDVLYNVLKWEILHKPGFEVSKKEELWKLLFYDIGLTDPLQEYQGIKGCIAGRNSISVMPDGTVLSCAKMMVPSGKYPEKKLEDIIINSSCTKKILERDKNEKCNSCKLNRYCCGCPAMKYAVTGDIHGQEPSCWMDLN